MKNLARVLSILFVLAALGGIVFLLGWTDLKIPEQHFGVMVDKNQHYQLIDRSKPWHAAQMFPRKNQLNIFPTTVQKIQITTEGTLPNTNLFAKLLFTNQNTNELTFEEIEDAFNYQLTVDLSIALIADQTVALFNKENLNVKTYLVDLPGEIQKTVEVSLIEQINSTPAIINNLSELERVSQIALTTKFPNIVVTKIEFSDIVRPNIELYNTAIATTLANAVAIRRLEETKAFQLEDLKQQQESQLELIESYGKILTQYPILIEFFAVNSQPELAKELLSLFFAQKYSSETPTTTEEAQ